MLTQDPAALKLLLTDDLYLLKTDRNRISAPNLEETAEGLVTDAENNPGNFMHKISIAGTLANGCLVLLNEPGFDTANPDTATALEKIFQARHTSLNDAGLINVAKTPVNFPQICKELKPKTMLILGISPNELELDKLAYNTPLVRDGIKILYSYAMSDMLSDDSRKKLFWEGLKLIL